MKEIKKILCYLMIIVLFVSSTPVFTYAQEVKKYPYAIFASSFMDDAITIDANNFCINGNIGTNGDILAYGNMNINGSKKVNANQNMYFMYNKLEDKYFSDASSFYTENYIYSDMNLNINNSIYCEKNIEFEGNINLNCAIGAIENVTLKGQTLNANNSVIYSKYGSIYINNSNVSITGLIYAPFGTVHIESQNINLNNVVVIADKVILDGNNINVNYNISMADFIGIESEIVDFTAEQWNALPDNNENNVPDCVEHIMGYGTEQFDSDKDGLPDFYEYKIKTDKNNVDSDGDGLPDGYELFTLNTYPTTIDTDNNGISDADEDFDTDGIINIKEYELAINPNNSDTDGDYLSDYEEVYTYRTEPLYADKDLDGLDDGLEIKYGMDPFVPDTLCDGILDGDRVFDVVLSGEHSDNGKVKPTISMELQGKVIRSLEIEKVEENDYFLNTDIPGYIGNAYDFSVEAEFSEATLSFEIQEELFENENFEPAIFYWNEATQSLEELDNQVIEGNIISVKLEHFSKYILVSKNLYNNSVTEYFISAPTQEEMQKIAFDVALVLDESGSVSTSNYTMMKSLCSGLVSDFSDNDKVAVFTFDHIVKKQLGFSNKELAIGTINGLTQSYGDTAIYDAIDLSVDEYVINDNSDSSKIMILLTDGEDNSSDISADTVARKAASNNIVIYTIGVGSVNTAVLQKIANLTGGVYYNVSNFSQLEGVFERIVEEADLYKDSDGDGISDYHEKKIARAELKGGTGTEIKNCSYLNYLDSDSDDDGISDGQELRIESKIVNGTTVYYCYLNSNPCMEDTDGDSYCDEAESYIGSNLFSSNNELYTVSLGSLSTNTWWDWKKMIDSHAWNYIHNLVQLDIVLKSNNTISKEEVLPAGRADLFKLQTGEIWEVKPASYAISPKKEAALAQLQKYVDCDESYKVGGGSILGATFQTVDGVYNVEYENMLNGLILYSFKFNTDNKPSYIKQKQKEDEEKKEEKEDEYEDLGIAAYQPSYTAEDVQWWGVAAGLVLIGGTLLEDAFSGGIGITNDAPSIALGLKLMGY